MNGKILTQPEQLPVALAVLLGPGFRPELRGDVLYVPSMVTPAGMAGLAFKFTLFFSVPAVLFFAAMLIQAVLRGAAGERFGGEGVGIAGLMAILPVALTLVSGRYWQRAKGMRQQIDRGELRLGLWITSTHLMQRDLNGGLECIDLADLESLSIYHSGRPPLAMVLLHLRGGQTLRVVADWLQGFAGNVEALRQLLADRCQANPARPWTLICRDLFDRESEPTEEGRGTELLDGLAQLWNKHLSEGLQDDGQRSFYSFTLRLEAPLVVCAVDDCLDHHAAGAPKLRRWLQMGDPQPLLQLLARTHRHLLKQGRQDAADRILQVAADAQDLADLDARLGQLD